MREIREFFLARDVLEVETPLLSATTVTDVNIESVRCKVTMRGKEQTWYLQTSPEYFMKRLLAAGSGPIYQICKSFRDGEIGRYHCPEFTMVEWYRPGFDHHRLMDEVDAMLNRLLGLQPAERFTYDELFSRHVGLSAHTTPAEALARRVYELEPGIEVDEADKSLSLDLLWTHLVQPRLGVTCPAFVYDFPACQAALARIRPGSPDVAERFEVFIDGVEIGNGYHEEIDADVLRRRFEDNQTQRQRRGQRTVSIDPLLLAAQKAGLPPCAGISIGIDRLVMRRTGAARIEQTLGFAPWLPSG